MSNSSIRIYELADELGMDCRSILFLLGDDRDDLTHAQYMVVKPRAARKLKRLFPDNGFPPPGPYVPEMHGGIQFRRLSQAEATRWRQHQRMMRSWDRSRRRFRSRDARAHLAASVLASLASLIAGPAHPWSLEAWHADLIHGPHGRRRPLGPGHKIAYSLGLLFLTAPRLRIQRAAEKVAAWAERQLDTILASNAKTATVATAAITVVLVRVDLASGLATATTTAVALIPAACAGIKWLRRNRPGPKRKDTHGDDGEQD